MSFNTCWYTLRVRVARDKNRMKLKTSRNRPTTLLAPGRS